MGNELEDYIHAARKLEYSDEEIERSLLAEGWDKLLVKGALLTKPQKKHRIFKVAFSTLGVIVAIAGLGYYLPNLYNLFVFDEKLDDNSSLQLRDLDIPEEQNALFHLEELSSTINLTRQEDQLLIDYIVRQEQVDLSTMRMILGKNQDAIRIFSELSKKPFFQDPNYDSGRVEVNSVISYSPIRQISRIVAAQVKEQTKNGEIVSALNHIEDLYRFAQILFEGQDGSVQFMVGLASYDTASRLLMEIVTMDSSRANLNQITERFSQYRLSDESYHEQLKFEYQSAISLINLIYQKDNKAIASWYGDNSEDYVRTFRFGPFNQSLVTQRNKTINLYTEKAKALISAPSVCLIGDASPERLPEPSLWEMLYAKNHLRNDFYNPFVSTMHSIAKKTCASQGLFDQALLN